MVTKHENAFIEVTTRYFIPMTSELWEQVGNTSLADIMRNSAGQVTKFEPKRRKVRMSQKESKKS